jgi:hypothetical protein
VSGTDSGLRYVTGNIEPPSSDTGRLYLILNLATVPQLH